MLKTQELLDKEDRLKRFALKLTKNEADADDLTQNTILRALEKKHLFKSGSNVFSWSSKIMYNLFISRIRKYSKLSKNVDPADHIDNLKVEATQDKVLELKKTRAAIQELKDDYKNVIVKVCIQGQQYEEVANDLDIPVGTVRSRLHRAREALKEKLVTNPYRDQPQGYASYSGHKKTAIAA